MLISDEKSLFNAEFDELIAWFEINREEVYSQKQEAKGPGWRVIAGNA